MEAAKKLEALDVPYSSVKGQGYRLHDDIELLDAALIRNAMSQKLDKLDILLDVPSTNTYVFERAANYMGQRYALLAEKQSAGKTAVAVPLSPFGKTCICPCW